MPAEWETHEATWLAWPHNPTDWPDKLDIIRWVYTEMVRRISPGERIRMLVNSGSEEKLARRYLSRAGVDAPGVEFIVHPTNRGWTRDSGPVFVRRNAARRLETAIVHFHFNAWAKYPDWRKDRRVPETAARRLGKRLFHAQSAGTPVGARRRRHRSERPRHLAHHRGVLRGCEDAGSQPRPEPQEFEEALRRIPRRDQHLLAGRRRGRRRHSRACR
jgi:hypothetical protein